MKNKKSIILLSGIILTLILTLSISYAFFYYVAEGDEISLTSGSISINFSEGTNYISLGNSYPKSDRMGKIDPNYYDFTVSGSKGENDDILYEIQIEHEEGNTLDEKYVKVYLTDQEDRGISFSALDELEFSEYNGNRLIHSTYIYGTEQSQDYRIRVWIDESYTENISKTFNFKVNVYALNNEFVSLYETLEETLSPFLLQDDGDARIVSGSKDDVNNNYVWYSGKLWRVVSLNNDGTIKLITDENITTIYWGEDATYENSWVYQWLNEDFLDTLYNYRNIIVTDYKWNATMVSSANKPEKNNMINAPIGMLTYYEYAMGCRNTTKSETYLNNNYYWWTITPYDNNNVWYIINEGIFSGSKGSDSPSLNSFGIRPCINLKTNILVKSGNGSENNPYIIYEDIFLPTKGELLNSRVSGEYVNFDDKVYRIVNIESGMTKTTMVNYLKKTTGEIIKKNFGSSILFGNSTNTKSADYWDYYLNNEWYFSLNPKYKNMIVEKKWYLGTVDYNSYKNAVCVSKNTSETIKKCEKTSILYSGYIGIGRLGEMFTSQLNDNKNELTNLWTMTPIAPYGATSRVFFVSETLGGHSSEYAPRYNQYAARPSMYLSSKVYITSGSGTLQDPFEIAMD